jgi:DNA polymerase-3 subunit epsilon
MTREIVLDTETTGLDPRSGHRVIEIACVELENLLPTGRHFHCYINPERDIDPDAERIHGLSRAFLADKPKFADASVAAALLDFVGEATLVAHNAGFDRAFLNHELGLAGLSAFPESRWVDTLKIAQKRFPGMFNSLDALCKRYKISLADREKHGALIDTQLLAQVYLELRGGREARLELTQTVVSARTTAEPLYHGERPRPLVSRLTRAEAALHEAFVAKELRSGALWQAIDLASNTNELT